MQVIVKTLALTTNDVIFSRGGIHYDLCSEIINLDMYAKYKKTCASKDAYNVILAIIVQGRKKQ